jgi:hypothetical protein
MEALTKSELATRLGVSRGRVSQLCSQGMPVLADGRVDFEAACQWINQHVDRAHSGWAGTRKLLMPSGATPGGNGQTQTVPVTPRASNAAPNSSDTNAQWRPPEVTVPMPTGVPSVGNDPGRVLLLAKAKKRWPNCAALNASSRRPPANESRVRRWTNTSPPSLLWLATQLQLKVTGSQIGWRGSLTGPRCMSLCVPMAARSWKDFPAQSGMHTRNVGPRASDLGNTQVGITAMGPTTAGLPQ